jgi:hypothetical protein
MAMHPVVETARRLLSPEPDPVQEMSRAVRRALVAAYLARRGVSLAMLSDEDLDGLIALVREGK